MYKDINKIVVIHRFGNILQKNIYIYMLYVFLYSALIMMFPTEIQPTGTMSVSSPVQRRFGNHNIFQRDTHTKLS